MTTELSSTKTVGERLRDRRLEQGKTLEDIAHRLHFSEVQLTHLERAEYALLPSLLVVRGMIRSYAQLLEMDGEDLILNFEMESPNEGMATPRLIHHHGIERQIVIPSRHSMWTQSLRLLGLGGVILIALFWWGMQKFKHSVVEVKVVTEKPAAHLVSPPSPEGSLSSVPSTTSATPVPVLKNKTSYKQNLPPANSDLAPSLKKPRDQEGSPSEPSLVEPTTAAPPLSSEEKSVTPIISP